MFYVNLKYDHSLLLNIASKSRHFHLIMTHSISLLIKSIYESSKMEPKMANDYLF